MRALRVSDAPRELRVAVAAMRRANADITQWVDAQLGSTFDSPWKQSVAKNVKTRQQQILNTGLAVQGNAGGVGPGFIMGAASNARFGRGLTPIENWAGFEFGVVHPARKVTYPRRSRNGGVHRVTRDVLAGHPWRTRTGHVYHRALMELVPRMMSFWTQSVIKAFMDASEEGR